MAEEVGLDVARFITDLESHRFEGAVYDDWRLATERNIKSPPALFINGVFFEGPRMKESLRAKIESLLGSIG